MIIRRETKSGSNDLNVVYRPCRIDEMVGNETNKKILKNALEAGKVHHTQLYTGDAGCGKTTAAKIVALGLNCENTDNMATPCLECASCKSILEGSNVDVKEINVGQAGGKDHVDAIVRDLPYAPFNSKFKVIIFDEAHELTNAAKDLLLKPIESGFEHVYYIFCTNQPEKLRSKTKDVGEAFLDRCFTLNFTRVSIPEVRQLLQNVCEFEGFPFNKDVLDIVAEESKGVPRNALMSLNKVAMEGSWSMSSAKEILSSGAEEDDPQVIELSVTLNKGAFKEAVELFGKMKTKNIESLRIAVAGFFVGCLKRARVIGDGRKYSAVLDVATVPIYEQGKLAEHKWCNYMFKITDIINSAGRRG